MPGRLTNLRNQIAAAFVAGNVTAVPTRATFSVAGVSAMKVRRVFGSFVKGMKNSFAYAATVENPAPAAPVAPNALANQSVVSGEALVSYPHAAFTDSTPTGGTLTYSATQSDGSALPAGLVYTPSTRTFSGTVTAEAGIYTIRVTAVDAYGKSGSGTFTLTVTEA